MKITNNTLVASGLLATAYASQEQVVFDGYPHRDIETKKVAIIGMDAPMLPHDTNSDRPQVPELPDHHLHTISPSTLKPVAYQSI